MRQRSIHIRDRKKRRHRILYIFLIQMLISIVMLAAAFYAPQMIFRIQDGILCGRTTFDKRENMDVETLSITYERQLSQRMENFAEGLEAGDHFYVASQDLTPSQELYDFLNSDMGLYQEIISMFVEAEWIYYGFWEQTFEVKQWKQYVIYSDDYAKGVNFICWYMELQEDEGAILKLLADAETGTIYAIKTENINHDNHLLNSTIWNEKLPFLLWYYFANYYEGSLTVEIEKIRQELERYTEEIVWDYADKYTEYNYEEWGVNIKIPSKVTLYENAGYDMNANELKLILPYGENSLDVMFLIDEESIPNSEQGGLYLYYRFPNMLAGCRQIYELIPEFS